MVSHADALYAPDVLLQQMACTAGVLATPLDVYSHEKGYRMYEEVMKACKEVHTAFTPG